MEVLLIFLLQSIFINTEFIIPINITKYHNGRPMIQIQYPDDKFSKPNYINTYLNYTLFHLVKFEYNFGKFKEKSTVYLDKQYLVAIYKTEIQINDILIPNLLLFNALNDRISCKEQGIGLGYHMKNETYSLVHYLYNNKTIEHRQFAFYNIEESLKGQLFLGGVPNNAHLTLPFKAVIKVNETLPTWGFMIDSVIINNTEYQVQLPAIISSSADSLITSEYLYELFENKILKEFIEYVKKNEMISIDSLNVDKK